MASNVEHDHKVLKREAEVLIMIKRNTYLYNNAAPAIPPPHWAVIYMAALIGEITLVTANAKLTAGFMFAPNQLGKWKRERCNKHKLMICNIVIKNIKADNYMIHWAHK